MTDTQKPVVGIIMGSNSDWPTMRLAAEMLKLFDIPYEARVVSAHRMPDEMFEYAKTARGRGLKVIIAGAGGAAHLPGMVAAKCTLPVCGVPIPSKYLRGEDSLLSIVQMPKGVPVGTFAIGEAGATFLPHLTGNTLEHSVLPVSLFLVNHTFCSEDNIVMTDTQKPVVGIIMGSNSDWPTMRLAAEMLKLFDIPYEARVVSAHRMPDEMFEYAKTARGRGLKVIIAGAGGAAHLPGMVAAKCTLPVCGVPIPSKYLRGEDSLLSIVQMPKGVPVGTFAIGEAGAANAALYAVQILSVTDNALAERLAAFRREQNQKAKNMRLGD